MCNSYGKQCNWQSMQVIKSVFIRKFHTQHNVLVHSSDYLCNENAQYLSLLKRIKIQRIQLIKNSFIMAYVQSSVVLVRACNFSFSFSFSNLAQ